jgi:hypothetical protein
MKTLAAFSLLLALLLVVSPLAAQEAPKPSLKGLAAVKLNISISNSLVEAGVNGARLRSQVELQMRRAGLQVDPSLSEPNLYLEITGVRGPGTSNYACFVSLSLSEAVKMTRNDETITACIWGPDMYVLYLPSNLESSLFQTTGDRVDQLLNDWLRVNPR